jgi:hypothetical protein
MNLTVTCGTRRLAEISLTDCPSSNPIVATGPNRRVSGRWFCGQIFGIVLTFESFQDRFLRFAIGDIVGQMTRDVYLKLVGKKLA